MAFVGTFLKNTTRVGYSYGVKRKANNTEQSMVLIDLLSKAKRTKFGVDFDFSRLLQDEDVCDSFRKNVPVFTYESFFNPYIVEQLEGGTNIAWPNKINHFALSSGTTTDSSKRIPVSDQMIKQFQKTTLEQLLQLHELNLPSSFYQSTVLTVGGSTKLKEINTYFEGDLSGILQKNKRFLYRLFSKPGSKISQMTDWNSKLDEIVKNAKKWDIGVIAGAPSWVLILLERIVKTYKVDSIHQIWPNFRIFLHGGVFLETYEDKIKALCSNSVFFKNTYLASEGFFAYQKNPNNNSMTLLTNHGVYYEFIDEKYFDLLRTDGDLSQFPTYVLNELKENANYGLVITTSSGLWRYFMGDVIKFTDLENLEIKIVGRVKHTLNVVGEHLSLENMNKAVQKTNERFGITAEEYCVLPAKKDDRHYWYIGSNSIVDPRQYSVYLNQMLEEINDDYRSVRKYLLKSPRVKMIPVERFYEFMDRKGKLGAQHKFPRVLNKVQALEWESFLIREI
ncbi:GH3 family domain-containing protein [Brumimicrobium mesophilum]|uniref:GH3 family domain-containing protein n=1 Tax=Brumimicrobium mesophilum TaxID=392717 RepID=UPI000D144D20|nr:GH3 auxin-responsive promoter family protein [Brumimicrobium mesophilum]